MRSMLNVSSNIFDAIPRTKCLICRVQNMHITQDNPSLNRAKSGYEILKLCRHSSDYHFFLQTVLDNGV